MASLFIQFSYLQMLDYLTTVAFLLIGVQEGNPFVRLLMESAPTPVAGLVLAKAIALGLGIVCWRREKAALLKRINWMFAALVVWNMTALIQAAARAPGV